LSREGDALPPIGGREVGEGGEMSLDDLFNFVETLRREAIGEPKWFPSRQVYEFQDHSTKVVAVLELIRAAQGVKALDVLRRNGLFIDFGMTMRGVNDAIGEVYFLLEQFPRTSANVDQFMKAFFESNIDEYLSTKTLPVSTRKNRSARVRYLKGTHDQETYDRLEIVFKTFSGYVHANYAHIMEIFGGRARDFNLRGVPSLREQELRAEHVELAARSVLHAAAFIAEKVGLAELHRDIVESFGP
jgi:hypothetical protein